MLHVACGIKCYWFISRQKLCLRLQCRPICIWTNHERIMNAHLGLKHIERQQNNLTINYLAKLFVQWWITIDHCELLLLNLINNWQTFLLFIHYVYLCHFLAWQIGFNSWWIAESKRNQKAFICLCILYSPMERTCEGQTTHK